MVSPEELAGPDKARQLFGAEVVDADGDAVGKVTEVFLDDDTDQPKWVSIRTGWFGNNESLVPLQGAEIGGDRIRVQYDKATIKAAPRSDDGQPLSRDDEGALYRHYHRDPAGRHARADESVETHDGRDDSDAVRRDDGSMVRSEERLTVGTERVAEGRARLRKYLVTEEQQITVSVAREDVRVEYLTDVQSGVNDPALQGVSDQRVAGRGNADDRYPDRGAPGFDAAEDARPSGRHGVRPDSDDVSDPEGWIVLYAQRPVVTMEWVPVERVRMGTVTATSQETVSGDVRKEQLEVLTDDAGAAVLEGTHQQHVSR